MNDEQNQAERLNKLLDASRRAKKAGFNAEQIDAKLKELGSSLNEMGAVMQYGAENIAKARQVAQTAKDPNNVTPADYVAEGVKGFAKGAGLGLEEAANALTFGGYDWANKKLGGDYERRRQDFINEAENAGLGGLTKGALTTTSIASSLANPINRVLPTGGSSTIGQIGAGALTGGAIGGLSSGFNSDFDTNEMLSGAGLGAALGGAIPAVGVGLKYLTGGITTGAGTRSVEQAFDAGKRGSKDFLDAMGGQTDIQSVVDDLDDLLKAKQSQASADYLAGMGQMAEKKVSIQPILDKIDDVEKGFNYHGLDKAGEGQRKVLDDVKKYVDMIKNKKDAQTIAGLDSIKQKIGNISTGSDRQADQLKTRLYNVVKSAISDVDPQYGKVMKGYESARNTIDVAQKELSAGKNPFTTLRKLQGMMRNDANSALGARTQALQGLGDTTHLMDKLAGNALSEVLPRGLRQVTTPLLGVAAHTGGLSIPAIIAAAPAFSPRVVGNVAYGLGRASNSVSRNALVNAILSQATQD